MNDVTGLSERLVSMLGKAESVAGVAFNITSGLRDVADNVRCSGVPDSAHLEGLAVDLGLKDDVDRFKVLKGLLAAGFQRLGVYEGHIHADISSVLPQFVAWFKK